MTVRALDEYTVEFVLPVSFAPFLRSLGQAIYPRHILEPYVNDGTFDSVWDIETDPREVIGTGPFTIARYDTDELLVLRRNPNYWLKDAAGNSLPYLDSIVYHIVEDFETELEMFQAGQTDAHGVLGEEYEHLKPFEVEGNYTIYRRGPGFGTSFLTFNMNPGANAETGAPYVAPEKLAWFQNTQFRRAVAHTVDKAAIVAEIQHGLGYPQWSSVSPAAGDFHNPGVRRYPYDIAAANQILDELGWVDTNGDGIREDKDGNTIEFTLATNGDNSVRATISQRLAAGMLAVGIKANYESIEFGELVTQLTATYDWEAIVIGLTGGTDPYSGIAVWHSSESLHLWYPNQPEPATAWEAEIDELYIQASQELDHAKRVKLYHQAQAIVAENLPLIYTTQGERLTATRNIFGNTTPTLYGLWDIRYLYRLDQ
jgi:peptide/nickel transport system substrate-binding protein